MSLGNCLILLRDRISCTNLTKNPMPSGKNVNWLYDKSLNIETFFLIISVQFKFLIFNFNNFMFSLIKLTNISSINKSLSSGLISLSSLYDRFSWSNSFSWKNSTGNFESLLWLKFNFVSFCKEPIDEGMDVKALSWSLNFWKECFVR